MKGRSIWLFWNAAPRSLISCLILSYLVPIHIPDLGMGGGLGIGQHDTRKMEILVAIMVGYWMEKWNVL